MSDFPGFDVTAFSHCGTRQWKFAILFTTGQLGKIENKAHGGKQYEWLSPYSGKGLTKPGMGRLNRSVEAFVYCIVGAEVNVRSSIVDSGGGGQETQDEMLKLFESAVIEEDIAKSVQRYQLVIQEAKLRLNFAIAPGIWLIPSNLVINTESVIGYNNNLLKANDKMIFGLNQLVNDKTKQVGLNHSLGNSKVFLPHTLNHEKRQSHDDVEKKTVNDSKIKTSSKTVQQTVPHETQRYKKNKIINSHDLNKSVLIILMASVGYYLFR